MTVFKWLVLWCGLACDVETWSNDGCLCGTLLIFPNVLVAWQSCFLQTILIHLHKTIKI